MRGFSQKYTIVQLLEDMPEGTEYSFKDWPLHCTVADVFAVSWSEAIMVNKLTRLLRGRAEVISAAEEDVLFGPEKNIRVTLLKKTPGLVKLHYDVVGLLEEGSYKSNNPEFIYEGFLPHVTVQSSKRLNRGDQVTFKALSLIDMFPESDPYRRKLLKTIKFNKA